MTRPEEPVLSDRPIGPITPPAPVQLPVFVRLAEIVRGMAADPDTVAAVDDIIADAQAAAPEPRHLDDGFGNGWVRCARGCDLEIVRPGTVQCSGVVCGEPK